MQTVLSLSFQEIGICLHLFEHSSVSLNNGLHCSVYKLEYVLLNVSLITSYFYAIVTIIS